jgi:hypothetical protein
MVKPDDIELGAWEMICAAERGDGRGTSKRCASCSTPERTPVRRC